MSREPNTDTEPLGREEIARSRSFVLELDDTTYVLTSTRANKEVARFPSTESGLESAIDEFDRRSRTVFRDRWLPRCLGILAITSATIWALMNALYLFVLILYPAYLVGGVPPRSDWLVWLGPAISIAYAFSLSSVAVLVVLYLWRRWPTND
ncbi:MAG: hypothetical protein QOG88_1721 [Actinomycetota bacterium]|jgi:hypothetical protein|nr:hypothetical protein [Actinomycetota bacterium]